MLSVGDWWKSEGYNGGCDVRELGQNESVKSRRRFHLKVGNVGSAELEGLRCYTSRACDEWGPHRGLLGSI